MARAALTTVPTSISQHVRRTASGEVVPVGGYRAGRLKDLGIKDVGAHRQVSTETFQQEHKKIESELYGSEGELRDDIPTDVVEQHAKRLYSLATESGVDPIIFSHETFLNDTYDMQNANSKGLELVTMHPRDAMGMLLDRDSIDTIIKSTDALESKFQKDFGVKAERVDPFTFKFESDWGIGFKNPELRQNITTLLGDRLSKLQKDNPDLFAPTSDPDPATVSCKFGQCLDDLEDVQQRGTKAFGKSLAASAVLCNVTRLKAPRLANDAVSSISNFLSKNGMNTFDYVDGKPADIRKLMTEGLSDEPNFTGKDDIMKLFGSLDDDAVVPALNLMSRNAMNPTFLLTNKEVLNRAQKMGNSIGQMFSATKSTPQRTVYVSRNPMNILTLAPEKSCPSCQTLTRDGAIAVSSFNVNVPASYNTQSTNDFVMFSMTGEGQKNARMSLSYNPQERKFVNYEQFTAYGDDRVGRTVLRQFVEDHPDQFGVSGGDTQLDLGQVKQSVDVQHTIDVLNKSVDKYEKEFHGWADDGDVDNAQEVFTEFDRLYNSWNTKKSAAVDGFLGEINDMYYDTVGSEKSLLYGSSAHNLVSGSKTIIESFAKDYKRLDKAYKDVHTDMKRKMQYLTVDED